jgi:hypothetical protein
MSEAATIDAPAATPAATPDAAPVGMLTGAPITPAASTPAPPAHFFGEHIAKEGVFNEGWSEQLRAAGFERLANKAQLAKDESTFFKSMEHTLGLVGKKQTGRIVPNETSSPEEWAQYRKEEGIPNTPDGYSLKPEKLPEGIQWHDEDSKAFAEVFHKHGAKQDLAKDLTNVYLEAIGRMADHGKEIITARLDEWGQESLKIFQKEWGDKFDATNEANWNFVKSRFKEQELQDPVIAAAMRHPAMARIINEARLRLREDPLPGVGHDVGGGSMTPRQQAMAIMQANPNWSKNPDMAKRVNDLYALDAAQAKRGR